MRFAVPVELLDITLLDHISTVANGCWHKGQDESTDQPVIGKYPIAHAIRNRIDNVIFCSITTFFLPSASKLQTIVYRVYVPGFLGIFN